MRIQAVRRNTNLRIYSLLGVFESLAGDPLLVNTAFAIPRELGCYILRSNYPLDRKPQCEHATVSSHCFALWPSTVL